VTDIDVLRMQIDSYMNHLMRLELAQSDVAAYRQIDGEIYEMGLRVRDLVAMPNTDEATRENLIKLDHDFILLRRKLLQLVTQPHSEEPDSVDSSIVNLSSS
jgi:hypothetical protein